MKMIFNFDLRYLNTYESENVRLTGVKKPIKDSTFPETGCLFFRFF